MRRWSGFRVEQGGLYRHKLADVFPCDDDTWCIMMADGDCYKRPTRFEALDYAEDLIKGMSR